jgi:hypothetical protein
MGAASHGTVRERRQAWVAMRIVVLWNACHGISRAEDADWVRQETEKLRTVDGIADLRLRRVESAALRHPRAWDWYLELQLGDDNAANAVVRRPQVDEFLADLRLLGTRPTVLAIDEDG